MKHLFAGKSIVITGATGGIGRATAERFAALGGQLVLHYHRRANEAAALCSELPGSGHVALAADLANPGDVQQLVDRGIDAVGRIDVLVNNAGVFEERPIRSLDYSKWLDTWQATIGVNLMGPANLSFLVARHMIDNGGGKIINVSSRGAFRGEPDAPAYGASKAGVNSLSQSLAKALAPFGVCVYAVAPGFVDTDMAKRYLSERGEEIRAQSPLGRVARPEEIAHTIAFLASDDTEYLTGAIVDINGASYLRS